MYPTQLMAVQDVCSLTQAASSRGHTREGSFINRSLLALGSVVAKLAEGGAAHIPFRDSKLTRLLQGSLAGPGAHLAVVCTATPAASQAEETHNTLKFAQRACKVRGWDACVLYSGPLCFSTFHQVNSCSLCSDKNERV